MATKTEYLRVTFTKPTRVFSGTMMKQGLDAGRGVRLFRVTDGVRDDLVIDVQAIDKRSAWDVPWANVASAQPKPVLLVSDEPEPQQSDDGPWLGDDPEPATLPPVFAKGPKKRGPKAKHAP